MTTVQPFNVRAHLIPFVTRVLHRGERERYQPTQWPVPTGRRDLYTADDMTALKAILPQGVLYAFCHRAQGWQQRPILKGRQAWSAQARQARLWEADQGLVLSFGSQALNLCESLYNAVARRPRKSVDKREPHSDSDEIARLLDLELTDDGDQLLTYWMLSGLWPQLSTQKVRDAQYKPTRKRKRPDGARPNQSSGERTWMTALEHLCARHPLLALRYGPWLPNEDIQRDDIKTLIEGPMRGLLPWWITHALGHWQAREATIWSQPPEAFIRTRTRQSALLRAWMEAINDSGWFHLLASVHAYYDMQARWLTALASHSNPATAPSDAWLRVSAQTQATPDELGAAALRRLDIAYSGLRHAEREALRKTQADMLDTIGVLYEACRARIRIHHADREANDTFLVNWAAENEVEALTNRLRSAARHIEGRLG